MPARQLIYKNQGIKKIVKLFELDQLEPTSIEDKLQLKKIILGCLLNILNENYEYQIIAIENDLIELIVNDLDKELEEEYQESILYNCLLILLEFIEDKSTIKSLKNVRLINNLVRQIQNLNLNHINTKEELEDIDFGTVESIIELLMQLNKLEDKKIDNELIKSGFLITLVDILDHELIENGQILKLSSNLIVTLLINSETSKKFFDNGNGYVYLKAKKWLNSSCNKANDEMNESIIEKESITKQNLVEKNDPIEEKSKPRSVDKESNQIITGALSIGNFCIDNESSIAICKDGLIDMLIKLIELNEDFSIQIACLSALRNLSLADHNKRYSIDNGVLTRLLRLSCSEVPPVVFNYLGALRLISDRQSDAAFEILSNHKFIDNLKTWGNLTNLIGIKAESSRILASLFKNLDKDKKFNQDHLMNKQLLGTLFEMVKSEHQTMQNEAISGIGFLINKFEKHSVVNDLLDDQNFIDNLNDLIRSYTLKCQFNELDIKSIQNILSVLSFSHIKYDLKIDDDLVKEIEKLDHPDLTSNVQLILKFKR